MSVAGNNWFEVDKEGLAKLLDQRGRAFVLFELISNSWDEEGVTEVSVSLTPIKGKVDRYNLAVQDDAPEGFHDLSHAFRLFAESRKQAVTTKRGRYNLGEKLVLAICDSARITTTTGSVKFLGSGRRSVVTAQADRRPAGSCFEAVVRITEQEATEALQRVRAMIPPAGIATIVNGAALVQRQPLRQFDVVGLPTVIETEGVLRRSARNTQVSLYPVLEGESAHIYEMGVPVVEHDGLWHVDVHQRVLLNLERDNVTPAYLRRLRTEILNHTVDLVTMEQTTATWVNEALSDARLQPEVVRAVIQKRFGPRAVAFDPSDREANKIAMSDGRPVIQGGSLSKAIWDNVRAAQALPPAGRVTPSPQVLVSPDGVPPIPQTDWSEGMRRAAAYARRLSLFLLGFEVGVAFTTVGTLSDGGGCLAFYGNRTITFNFRTLGRKFFDQPDQTKMDELLLHEYAHERVSDHLSRRFYDELCRLGAKMRDCPVTLEQGAMAGTA